MSSEESVDLIWCFRFFLAVRSLRRLLCFSEMKTWTRHKCTLRTFNKMGHRMRYPSSCWSLPAPARGTAWEIEQRIQIIKTTCTGTGRHLKSPPLTSIIISTELHCKHLRAVRAHTMNPAHVCSMKIIIFEFESSLDLCFHYFRFCAGFGRCTALEIEKNVMRVWTSPPFRSMGWQNFKIKWRFFAFIYAYILLSRVLGNVHAWPPASSLLAHICMWFL